MRRRPSSEWAGVRRAPERLDGVLAVLFLAFDEGYLATGDGDPVRAELTDEAIRVTRILRGLLPDEPEVTGLLALMVLIEARRESRVRHGQLVPLNGRRPHEGAGSTQNSLPDGSA